MRRACTLALVGVLLATASAARPTLRCCAIIEAPMISCKQEGQKPDPEHFGEPLKSTSSEKCSFQGLAILYYHLLRKAVPDFKCTETHLWETVLDEESLDRKYNGFTGFTKYLKDCDDGLLGECTCNIGVGGFSRNPDRELSMFWRRPTFATATSIFLPSATRAPWPNCAAPFALHRI